MCCSYNLIFAICRESFVKIAGSAIHIGACSNISRIYLYATKVYYSYEYSLKLNWNTNSQLGCFNIFEYFHCPQVLGIEEVLILVHFLHHILHDKELLNTYE